jgi:hypothetical protein
MSDVLVDGARRLVVSEMERQEQFEELSLLWAWVLSCVLPLLVHHRWGVTYQRGYRPLPSPY